MYKLFDADSVRRLFQQMLNETHYYRIPEYCEFIKKSLNTASPTEESIIQKALTEELHKMKDIAFGTVNPNTLRLTRLLFKQLNKVTQTFTEFEIDNMYMQALAHNPTDKDAKLYCQTIENKLQKPVELDVMLSNADNQPHIQSEEIVVNEEPPLKLLSA